MRDFDHSPSLSNEKSPDTVLKLAKRDNRVRRCLASARYYSGLGADTCDRIDAVLRTPFPAAARPKPRPRKR